MSSQTEKNGEIWESLSPDQKLERRIQAWLSPQDISFVSPQARADYQARAARIMDAMLMKQPDRVPILPSLGGLLPLIAAIP
jgi:hypothetical protein